MKLSEELAEQFDASVRQRGLEYFKQNKVKPEQVEPESIKTVVHGSQPYRVEFWRDPKTKITDAYCSCTHFRNGHLCKHLWATLLYADEIKWNASESNISSKKEVDPLSLLLHEPWMGILEQLKTNVKPSSNHLPKNLKAEFIFYYFNGLDNNNTTSIEIKVSERKQNGEWLKAKPKVIEHRMLSRFLDDDKKILSRFLGLEQEEEDRFYYLFNQRSSTSFSIDEEIDPQVIKDICLTERASFKSFDGLEIPKLIWSDHHHWSFKLNFNETQNAFEIDAFFESGRETLDLSEVNLLLEHGLIFWENKVSKVKMNGMFSWFQILKEEIKLVVPQIGKSKLKELIYSMPQVKQLDLPENLMMELEKPKLHKKIILHENVYERSKSPSLLADVIFEYDSHQIVPNEGHDRIPIAKDNRVILRDLAHESQSIELLYQLGFKAPPSYLETEAKYFITTNKFSKAMSKLIRDGWEVEAEGNKYEIVNSTQLQVSSGMDWFELHGELTYENTTTNLADVFEALKKGDEYVRLGDGRYGILPLQWLQDVAPMIKMGDVQDQHIKFKKNQTALLDALLAGQTHISLDQQYRQYREKLLKITEVKAEKPTSKFMGELRDYQCEGLGWLSFLNQLGLGGCLADDMGLGKTVQVLALLQSLQERASSKLKPSLIVVPRSLIFNWREEASKFTPNLKIFEYSGSERSQALKQDLSNSLIITTYGMIRQDILKLKKQLFHYIVLDEAQAIKNPNSQVAKASRLLSSENRLVMSGTPIENDLNDIWSIFEFLNPGMLGKFKAFGKMKEHDSREFLKKALHPFILRRTKAQVAQGLPEKTEQTIYCEMGKEQQAFYDDLKNYYQAGLMKKIQSDGMGKVKIQVLEALLRLRQAACHPALVTPEQAHAESSKLEVLFEQLQKVIAEGHKALVFSQFTSLLSLFRKKLDQNVISYAYLDGQTKKREKCVDDFQNNEDTKLFLISLKAGGVGLNLTAAEYVFILDPWWNPAVEAQAIDRAHRIGQVNKVFAYRLITKNTVEEKILHLQKHKRQLAESIISKDNSVMKKLTTEDLDFLLS